MVEIPALLQYKNLTFMCGLTPHSNKKKSASRPGKKFLWKNL